MGISFIGIWFSNSYFRWFYIWKMDWNCSCGFGLNYRFNIIIFVWKLFFKDLIKEKFLNKYKNLELKFKKSEFIYLLIYRFIGGVPWQLSCILPAIFNVKTSNFFFATLIGIVPQVFLVVSIGDGLEKIIDQNSEVPSIFEIIVSSEIYIPIVAFFVFSFNINFIKKIFL